MKSSFSSWPQHENFEELAALAAVGELSALELERLRHHLAECSRCRDAYEAFADIASNDLGVAVAARESVEDLGPADANTQAREHLERLRGRLKADDSKLAYGRESPKGAPTSRMANQHGIRAAAYGIAAVLLLSVVVAGGIAFWRSAKIASAARAHSPELQGILDSLKQQTRDDRTGSSNAVLRSLQESQRTRDALQRSLAASQAKNEELLAGERGSQEKLAEAIATAEQLRQQLATNDGDRQRLAKLQQESDAKLHEALVELYQARQANAQVAAKGDAPGEANLEANGQPSPETGPVTASPSEIEARNLFGARDLHIVDVYDVKGDGKTKRTYGRVYYVEKRLLVFYAFDLQNRQNHERAVFQAWGYREANVGKPLNLGLFAIDDSAMSRWVLKVNRADVLSHIDAVFVTVEPPGGSTAPRGKKVLYANLVGPPNHP